MIGAGMAGLMAARVLSDHFARVVVLERDRLVETAQPRRGAIQGHHLHGLLAGGVSALEALFPGFVQRAEASGGLIVDVGSFATWYVGGMPLPEVETGLLGLLMSRPLLELQLRAALRKRANVSFQQGVRVTGLVGSAWKIDGVAVSDELGAREIRADLVVDASGRAALLATWLKRFGLPAPVEDRVRMELTYTSLLIQRKRGQLEGKLGYIYSPTPPGRRAGAALAVEGERFIVTLMGYLGERAPRDYRGMVEYARSLPVSGLYELLRDAEPATEPVELRDPESVRRRYERLKHWPEGVLPIGDALCSLNPSYGHGMTLAALEAQVLDQVLRDGVRGLPARFFAQVTPLLDVPWSLVAGADLEFEGVTVVGDPPPATVRRFFQRALRAGAVDREVALAIYRVMHLVAPPSVLFTPEVVRAVLAAAPAEDDASWLVFPSDEGAV